MASVSFLSTIGPQWGILAASRGPSWDLQAPSQVPPHPLQALEGISSLVTTRSFAGGSAEQSSARQHWWLDEDVPRVEGRADDDMRPRGSQPGQGGSPISDDAFRQDPWHHRLLILLLLVADAVPAHASHAPHVFSCACCGARSSCMCARALILPHPRSCCPNQPPQYVLLIH
eukprot:6604568-Pyramimonas_sp.AAC.1